MMGVTDGESGIGVEGALGGSASAKS